jgi:hypothetical protein
MEADHWVRTMTAPEPPAAAQLPAIVIADADPDGRDAMQSVLARRFGADYRVLAADSAASGLALLDQLARAGSGRPGRPRSCCSGWCGLGSSGIRRSRSPDIRGQPLVLGIAEAGRAVEWCG